MEKKQALLLSVLLTVLVFSNVYLISLVSDSVELESVMIKKAVDGDTLDLQDGRRIRLLNINSPESNMPLSELSFVYLKNLENSTVQIEITGKEIYGRDLARVYNKGYINIDMVSKGLSHTAHVEDSEMNEFMKKQDEAFIKGIGIWKRSPNYGCLKAEIHKKEEFLTIENICSIDFDKVALKDESTRTFRITIPGKSKMLFFSEKGENSGNKIYLGSSRNIWNDDKDSIFIREEDGLLLFYEHYGY
ncbi:hypothetical protein CO038_02575 [Candidatus Pacearchaeota archaeon CG_4_9_14_0_2_um_filter_39_13]|nr:hypothetical protein [Candidatus Pacearchaeota archaeon]OIO44127.1 MAG: hypothetical protein AUJ64_00720 [Candidatus Pacearchaeota archaeon CG1_02_39_14]PJC44669.1 MAG: hypothetical protein CO038_02575 [Candidatus Pacearchaeota archaeon CG_4_9_14_0_2_um_filter_39_13]